MAALAAESAAATPMDADGGLDDKESELYDRQIRLWGVEAQKRIQNSKILMVGVGGLVTKPPCHRGPARPPEPARQPASRPARPPTSRGSP